MTNGSLNSKFSKLKIIFAQFVYFELSGTHLYNVGKFVEKGSCRMKYQVLRQSVRGSRESLFWSSTP